MKSTNCPDCKCDDFEKCLEILNLMLDNEATELQEAYFKSHIESCMVCFAHYNIEVQLRKLVKTKAGYRPIPLELAEEIRAKIVGSK